GRQRWHALVSKHPRQGAAGHRRDRPQAAHRQRAGGSGAHRVPARLGSHAAAAGCAGECARRQQRGGAGRARRGDHLMAVVNEHGATATTLNEYLEQIRQAHLAIDPDWNIEPESPDGLRIAIEAELLANLDEAVLHAYQSVDPLTAIGQQLNRIAQFAGLTRQAATPSTATVTFTGTNGTLIPAGTQIRNSQTDTLWTTDGDVTISDGTATVGVTCTTPGPEPAAVGTLSIIATPVGGVQSVTNTAAASLGRSEEGDDAFRVRRYESVALPGSNQVDNLYAAIGNVDGVKQVRIYENEEDAPDANGVAGHSLAIF